MTSKGPCRSSRSVPEIWRRQFKSPDGQYRQIPWKANPVMIMYNKDIFKAAGLDPENPKLSTYDEFLDTSRKIVASGAANAAIWPAPSSEFFQTWFDFYPLYAAQAQEQLITPEGESTFANENGYALAEFWRTMYEEGLSQQETYPSDSFADLQAAHGDRWSVGPEGLRRATHPSITGRSRFRRRMGSPPLISTHSPTQRTSACTPPARIARQPGTSSRWPCRSRVTVSG